MSLQDVTRNSSGDETANVNFLYDDIVYYKALRPPQTAQHSIVTMRSHKH